MTKARDIADFKFEDIVDTGTEGTKVASGTTAQRGSTAGQIRFNTTNNLAEYYDGTQFKSIDAPPTISSISPTEIESSGGGTQNIVITGSNFVSGATVKAIANNATEVTAGTVVVNSTTQITATFTESDFSNSLEPYDIKVTNVSGLSATLADQLNVDNAPSWNTASGNIATISDQATGTHATLSATDADGDTVSYSETGGTNITGAGLSLNSSTGVISGDPTDVSASTTVSFTGRATAGSKTTDRSFNIIIDPFRNVQFALLGAGGGGGSQDNGYQNGNDENQGEGGCGSLITATYAIKLGTTIYYYVGSGGEGGLGQSPGNNTTYGGNGGGGSGQGSGQGVSGGEGGNLVGLFMANAISNTNALMIAGSGGGGAGRPAGGGRDESNGGGGIENSSGEGNDGTLGHEHLTESNAPTPGTDLPEGGNKNAGGGTQSFTVANRTVAGTSGSNFNGGTGGTSSQAWGQGGGGGAGLYGGGGGSSSSGWGGNGGGAGSSFVRGLITDYTDTNLNNNFATGITYSTGAFTIQSYGHTGGALSGQDSGSGRGLNGHTSYSMRNPSSFSTYIGSLTLTDYGYGGNTGYNNSRGETGKQGIIAYKIGTGSWTQLTTTDTLTSLTIS
jgi:hypothetical protein